MRKSVRRVLYRFLPSRLLLLVVMLLTSHRKDLTRAWGFARSVRLMRCEDAQGRPLPWLPYCAIELLQERLRADLSVLEFGSGYSTLFFMTRVGSVTSVEHHEQWLATVRARTTGANNVTLLQASDESGASYTAPVRALNQKFDVILNDGKHRVDCFKLALECLTERGVLLLDDSDRSAYAEMFPAGTAAGFRTLHLRSHKPDSVELHRLSIFYRDGNCLGI